MLDINQIKEFLPHRFPFLLVDRILELEPGKRVVGIKNVTANDFYNNEHFDGNHTMPGVLQIEAMAQVAGFLVKDLLNEKCEIPFFASLDRARFRKNILPGDQLRIEVILKKYKTKTGKFQAIIYVDGEIASEANFTCILAPAS